MDVRAGIEVGRPARAWKATIQIRLCQRRREAWQAAANDRVGHFEVVEVACHRQTSHHLRLEHNARGERLRLLGLQPRVASGVGVDLHVVIAIVRGVRSASLAGRIPALRLEDGVTALAPGGGTSPLLIGWREYVGFPEWDVRRIKVKIDTGARTSALDVAEYHLREVPGQEPPPPTSEYVSYCTG